MGEGGGWVVIRMIGVCQYTIDLVQCTCRHKVNRLSGNGWFICGPRESNTERGSTEGHRTCYIKMLDLDSTGLAITEYYVVYTDTTQCIPGNVYIEGW